MKVSVYVEAFLYYFDLVRTNPEVYKNWLKDDIRLVVLNKYRFDKYQRLYKDVQPYEIEGKGYIKGGKSLENKRVIETLSLGFSYDADDVVWQNTSLIFDSFVLYNKNNNMLIGCIEPCDGKTYSTNEGTLTVVWNEKGCLIEDMMPK